MPPNAFLTTTRAGKIVGTVLTEFGALTNRPISWSQGSKISLNAGNQAFQPPQLIRFALYKIRNILPLDIEIMTATIWSRIL